VCSGAQAAGAEGEPVVRVGHHVEEGLDVGVAGDDARQAQYLEGWVVGVHAHLDVPLVADGHDGLQEVLHVGAELCGIDAFVQGQQLAELLDGLLIVLRDVAVHESLRPDDDVVHQPVLACGVHRLAQFGHPLQRVGVVSLFRVRALQNIDVEVGKFGQVEVEAAGAVRVGVFQRGTCPVEHGHEVVAHRLHAGTAQVFEAHDVVLDETVAVGAAVLDAFAHGQALHDTPAKTAFCDEIAHFCHFFQCPHLAVGDVVEGGDDTFNANLAQHTEGNLIVGSKPTPCLFHIY